MGYRITTAIWEKSKAKGSDLLVLLAIGDSADNTTGDAYPSIMTLAELSRLSERAVRYSIRRLEMSGELCTWRRPGHKTSIYHVVLFDGLTFDQTGAKIAPQTAQKEGQRLPLKGGKDCPCEGGKFTQEEGQSTTHGIERARVHLEPVLNQQSLSHTEREGVVKDLKRLFPQLSTVPESISSDRVFLFWYKVRTGEISSKDINRPIGFMSKMHLEDIGLIFSKDARAKKFLQSVSGGA